MPTNDTLIRGLCPQPRQVQLTEGQFPLPSVLTWTGPDEVINAVTILTERLAPALDVVRATSHTDDASLTVIVDPALERRAIALTSTRRSASLSAVHLERVGQCKPCSSCSPRGFTGPDR